MLGFYNAKAEFDKEHYLIFILRAKQNISIGNVFVYEQYTPVLNIVKQINYTVTLDVVF